MRAEISHSRPVGIFYGVSPAAADVVLELGVGLGLEMTRPSVTLGDFFRVLVLTNHFSHSLFGFDMNSCHG